MMILRAIYMVLASIILMPIIVLVEVLFLGVCIWACCKIKEPEKAIWMWYGYLKAGINMNLDFIKNGLGYKDIEGI